MSPPVGHGRVAAAPAAPVLRGVRPAPRPPPVRVRMGPGPAVPSMGMPP